MHSTIVKAMALSAIICFALTASAQNDSLYRKRLQEISSPVPVKYTSEAGKHIADFISNPSNTSAALGRFQYFKPSLDSILGRYGIPVEMGFYVLGASDCNMQFGDNNGNSGAWAMPYQVGRSYDLKMNTYVDERRDWLKSTTAAARHLQDLHVLYNDWGLALAAFTNSTATINRYIRVAGNKFSYWEIHDSLPYDLRQAMPMLAAGMYIYNYYGKHSIHVKAYHPVAHDTLSVFKWVSFEKLATALQTSINVLQDLNPEFKRDVIPMGANPYVVKLPAKSKPYFDQVALIEFEPYNMNSYLEEVPELEDKDLPIRKSDSTSSDSAGKPAKDKPAYETIYHKVTSGQSLGIIAQKYGVGVSDIKRWNNLKKNTIYPGQKLKIIRKRR